MSGAETLDAEALAACEAAWAQQGYVPLPLIERLARSAAGESADAALARLLPAFNGSDRALEAISRAAGEGGAEARALTAALAAAGHADPPYRPIDAAEFARLRAILADEPEALLEGRALDAYPYHVPGRSYGYEIAWVRAQLARSAGLLETLRGERRHDVAVLVGNGPSLNRTDLSLLEGQDVFISNYAVKHPLLSRVCTGVAVSNYLVAEQEPWRFMLPPRIWKLFPFWLRNTIVPDERTILLNAEGGELFCSPDVTRRIAWHSTVSYFWLQVLYHLGYERVLLIGVDNSYTQAATLKEGDLVRQTEDDPNHFDPTYFKGKTWQAADTDRMAQAYALAGRQFAMDGREIVNCTVGGKLELFRRGELAAELPARAEVRPRREQARAPQAQTPRIALVTPFWKGDAAGAERHWRLVNRVGHPGLDHYHLFKHEADELPPVTFPRPLFAGIERRHPQAAALPHPAGPNLCFVETVRLMREMGYSHFFWLEPDCIPTRAGWLEPFLAALTAHPDAPIVGAGGGSVRPGTPHWKHHFAGCSLYSVAALSGLDWTRFIERELHISFDIWLTLNLGFIELTGRDEDNTDESIIVGAERCHWRLLERPRAVVSGMFEHWRPDKIMSREQLRDVLASPAFSLFHAVKEEALVREVFARVRPGVSTLVINYNNAAFLREAIDSALAQEIGAASGHQVVVVDDGSDDASAEIIASYGDRVVPVMLAHGELNGNFNQQRALKAALPVLSGEIVCLLDGDDRFLPGKIEALLPLFDDPDVVLAQHALAHIDGTGEPLDMVTRHFDGPITMDSYLRESRNNHFQPTSGLAFRRCYLEAASDLLGFDGHHRTWLDVRLTRFAPLFGRVANVGDTLGSWRRHAASDSIDDRTVHIRVAEHHDWYNALAAPLGFALEDHRRMRQAEGAAADPLARLAGGGRLVARLGEEGTLVDGTEADAAACEGLARGRIGVLLTGGPVDPATLGRLSAFDWCVDAAGLDGLRAACAAGGQPAGYGLVFVHAARGRAAALDDALEALRRASGRPVFLVETRGEAADPLRDGAAVVRLLGYAGFSVFAADATDDAVVEGALPRGGRELSQPARSALAVLLRTGGAQE